MNTLASLGPGGTFSGPPGVTVEVDPLGFRLLPGGSRTLTVTVTVEGGALGDWLFGEVLLTPNDPTVSATRLTMAVIHRPSTDLRGRLRVGRHLGLVFDSKGPLTAARPKAIG